MKKKVFIALSVVGAVALLATFALDEGSPTAVMSEERAAIPELAGFVNDASEVSIMGGDQSVTLRRNDTGWGIEEKGGYPADWEQLRSLLSDLAQAEHVEQKTARPEHYALLGLAAPDADEGAGTRVSVTAGDRQEIVIIGKPGRGNGTYLRIESNPQTWLVDKHLSPKADVAEWLNKEILDLKSELWQQVTVTIGDEAYTLQKATPDSSDFELLEMPEGGELKFAGATRATPGAMASLRLDDVKPRTEVGTLPVIGSVSYIGFDGWQLDITLVGEGDDAWVTFDVGTTRTEMPAGGDPLVGDRVDEEPTTEESQVSEGERTEPLLMAAAEATELKEKVSAWAYKLPSYTLGQLKQPLSDMLKDPEAEEKE